MVGPAPIEFGFLFTSELELRCSLLVAQALPQRHRQLQTFVGWQLEQFGEIAGRHVEPSHADPADTRSNDLASLAADTDLPARSGVQPTRLGESPRGVQVHKTPTALAKIGVLAMSAALAAACRAAPSDCGAPPELTARDSSSDPAINLHDSLAAGRLRIINRQVTPLTAGNGVHVTAAPGIGLIWIDGTDFANGTIEADVCGRDVQSESFLGLAFHRRDDETYEAVYLRPFNFRAASADRRQHAVQYFAMPGNDYARLRYTFPGQFEGAVDAAVVPAAWNRLRLVVRNGRVQAFVGNAAKAALDVRELQPENHGQIGLYVDNGSDGAFANLRTLRNF
jgi:hypothetical protein